MDRKLRIEFINCIGKYGLSPVNLGLGL